MTHEELTRLEEQLEHVQQHISRAVAALKTAEFDLEEPEFFDFKAATAWVTKLDACADRGGKPVPIREAAPPAPEAPTVSDDDERTIYVDIEELGL